MTRIKAAFTHLLISAALSTVVICLLVFGWYPLPFFWALGGLVLLILIIGIDVVLGPMMTLILFNPKKSRRALTLDLTLIALVQIAALSYGVYSGYASRVVFNVFDGKTFHLVQAGDIPPDFLSKGTLPRYRTLPSFGQLYAAIDVPNDVAARSDMVFYGAFGVGPQFMPQYYITLEAGRSQLQSAAIDRTRLQAKHSELLRQIDALLRTRNLTWQQVATIPFEVKTATYTAVVDLKSATLLKVLTEAPL